MPCGRVCADVEQKLKVEVREPGCGFFLGERKSMENWIKGKNVIVIGERDGVQGPSIAECVEAAGGKVVYAVTECFV